MKPNPKVMLKSQSWIIQNTCMYLKHRYGNKGE